MRKHTQSAHTREGFSLIELLVSMALFTVVMTMSVSTLLVLIDANAKAQNIQEAMTNLTFAIDSMTREIRTGTQWYCGRLNGNQRKQLRALTAANPYGGRDFAVSGFHAGKNTLIYGRSCSNSTGGSIVAFTEGGGGLVGSLTEASSKKRIGYVFLKDYYGPGHGAILRQIDDVLINDGAGNIQYWFPVTSPDVKITDMKFSVFGIRTGNKKPSINSSPAVKNQALIQPKMVIAIEGEAGVFSDTKARFSIQTTATQRLLDL